MNLINCRRSSLTTRRDESPQLITTLQVDNRDVILAGLRAAQKQFNNQ